MHSSLSLPRHFQMGREMGLVLPAPSVSPEIAFKTSRVLQAYSSAVQASSSRQTRVRNSCFDCGATSYRSVVERDKTGTMRPSGRYQCVQCRRVFTDIRQWREGVCK
jgi:transposase-like protein